MTTPRSGKAPPRPRSKRNHPSHEKAIVLAYEGLEAVQQMLLETQHHPDYCACDLCRLKEDGDLAGAAWAFRKIGAALERAAVPSDAIEETIDRVFNFRPPAATNV